MKVSRLIELLQDYERIHPGQDAKIFSRHGVIDNTDLEGVTQIEHRRSQVSCYEGIADFFRYGAYVCVIEGE